MHPRVKEDLGRTVERETKKKINMFASPPPDATTIATPRVTQAPFLGVYSAMCDTSLPLTVHEFDEWGNPGSSEEVDRIIRSYCPYENVQEQEYPALLVTASVNDNR